MNNQLVSSSSSSSSSSSFCIDSTPSWTYDVFLSFRGEDTRTNFTDHLYKALVDKGIHTFIDRQLVRGEEISPALLQAIEESRISLVIFSKTYAASRWCLDELVKIFQCRQSKQQIVLPVFYKVDPSHVRNQTSSFGDEFKTLECKFEDDKDKEKILAWRSALREAADLSGHPVKEGDYEATLISNIVEDILLKVLDGTYLDEAKYPVGIQSCVQEVKDLLGVDGNGRRVVGIWGTSGVGKTTIARAVYNAIARKFQVSCFLADVRETLTSREGLIQLQKTFLSEILRGTKLEIVDVHEGIRLIKNRLRQKKILLILDDVDQLEQLKNWVDVDCFGEGSRVIITTKDRSLLDFYGGQWIYEVKKLEDDKALELFSWNAFERNRPPDDYLSLAQRAIAYAQGLPLALNIIGSHLRNKRIDRWQAILDGYDSYDGEPYTIIEKILRKTYDAWDYGVQQVFLDIACFFIGENKDYMLQMLRSSTLNVREDIIDVLVEKAIIAIEHNRILMHNLLQKMGKQIVYEESPTEPGKRSRLWHHEDVRNVLIDCRGTKKIRGIIVNLPEPKVIPLNAKSFSKMVNLEYFINRNAHFSGCVDDLPNSLRLIEFGGRFNIDQKHTYVLNLPSNFHPRDLVSFDVSYSGIRQLKGFKDFAKLTQMKLSGCKFLEKTPDLSGSTNIRELDLSGCTSLVEVDDSVGFLDKLEKLSLWGCSKLTRFATRLGLRSLKELFLIGCTRLERFPEIEKDKMKSLTLLRIGKSGIRELPSSIAYLTGLLYLYADGCELQNVPDLSGFLDKLEYLDLSGCSKLTRFGTRLGLRSLKELDLEGCTRLERFPEIEKDKMKSLRRLKIGKSGIRELPSSIAYLTGLTQLTANGCELQNVPDLSGNPNLWRLDLSDCTSLVEVHDSVGFLDKLQNSLPLGGCTRLESFPEIEGKKARRLQLSLDLSGCKLSESDFLVPLDCWSELRELNLSRNNFVSLPDCISEAVNLETLYLRDCKTLREIPVLPPKLESLHLDGCTSLENIPKLPPSLNVLTLCNCSGLSGDEVAKLAKLLVAKLENNFLNEEIYLSSKLNIIYPGNEVLKCFNYTSNHPTTVQPLSEYERDVYVSEFRFEIPLKLQVGETLTGLLAVSLVLEPSTSCSSYHKSLWMLLSCEMGILVNRTIWYERTFYCDIKDLKATHVSITTLKLWNVELQGDICQVGIRMCKWRPIKSCGVHFLLRNQDELLPLSLRPTSSLGKRPHPRGSSDIVDDAYDQQQQWLSSSSEPADDHPKSRPIDLNVPVDIEEDEEQLHLSLRPTSSLGKRPRPHGSSDVVDDEYDQQQQWLSSSSEPADDHPKRRQIDPNVLWILRRMRSKINRPLRMIRNF